MNINLQDSTVVLEAVEVRYVRDVLLGVAAVFGIIEAGSLFLEWKAKQKGAVIDVTEH